MCKKKSVLVVLSMFFLISCSHTYYEYEVLNNTSQQVFVEIITFGGEYQKTLSYTIDPGQRCNVFEHSGEGENGKMIFFSKYIEQINFRYGAGRELLKKKFAYNNLQLVVKKGLFGIYHVYTFTINQNDIE